MFSFAVFAALAEGGLGLELVHKFYSPGVTLCEFPFMFLVNNLEFVRQFMSAYFINLE